MLTPITACQSESRADQSEASVSDIDQSEASRVIAYSVSAVNQQDIMGVTMIRKYKHSLQKWTSVILLFYILTPYIWIW